MMKKLVTWTLILTLVAPNWVPEARADTKPCAGDCGARASGVGTPAAATSLETALGQVQNKLSGPACHKTPSTGSCLLDRASCLPRMALGDFTLADGAKGWDAAKGCLSSLPGCLASAVRGFVRMAIFEVTGMTDMLRGAVGLVTDGKARADAAESVKKTAQSAGKAVASAGRGAVNSLRSLVGVENSSSVQVAMLSGMNTAQVASAKKNPLEMIQGAFRALADGYAQFAKENLLCAKWSGVPHASKCEQSFSDYDCASCGDKVNGICQVLGGAVEALFFISFTVGTAAAVAAKLGQMSRVQKAAAAVKASRLYQRASTSETMAKVGAAAAKAAAPVGKAVERMNVRTARNSEVAQTIKAAKESGKNAIVARAQALSARAAADGQGTLRLAGSYYRGRVVNTLGRGLNYFDELGFRAGSATVNATGRGIDAIRRTMAAERATRAGVALSDAGRVGDAAQAATAARTTAAATPPAGGAATPEAPKVSVDEVTAIHPAQVRGEVKVFVEPTRVPEAGVRAEAQAGDVNYMLDGKRRSSLDPQDGADELVVKPAACTPTRAGR